MVGLNTKPSRIPPSSKNPATLGLDRHVTAQQRDDPLRVGIHTGDAVTEIGQTGTGYEPTLPAPIMAMRMAPFRPLRQVQHEKTRFTLT
jgi:hypothetical protein